MRLDGSQEQTDTRPFPHDKLVQLHGFSAQTRAAADVVGKGDDLLAPRDGSPAVFSDAAIQFCLTIKVLFKLPLRQTAGMVASPLKMACLGCAGLYALC